MKSFKSYYVHLADALFILAYGFALFRGAIGNTTFLQYFSTYGPFLYFTILFVSILLLYKIIFLDKYKIKDFLILLTVIFILGFSFLYSGYSELIILALLILGSKNIKINKVVKTHLIVYGVVTFIAALCSFLGIIENYNLMGAYSLGNTYPTDFAAGILAMTLDYAYLKTNKWKLKYTIVYTFIALAVYHISLAKTSAILIFALGLFELIFNSAKMRKFCNGKRFRMLVAFLFPAMASISLLVQGMFDKLNNSVFRLIDIFLSYRISYGYQAIHKFGLKPWGRKIDFIGAGWHTEISSSSSYFYVDNGYLQCALLYGMVIMVFFCLGYFYLAISKKNVSNFGLMIVLLFYSIWGVIEPRIFNLIYAPFLIVIGITFLSNMYEASS